MAISKTQNERPAIAALIDAVNSGELTVAQIVQNVATLTENLDIEISNRENEDADIQSQIGAVTQGFQRGSVTLQNKLDSINQWQDRFRMGLSADVTVAAGGSTSDMLIFGSTFDSSAKVAVFPTCVNGSANLADLSCKVTRANYEGFSFDVHNDTQAEVTIKVGYLAVKVN